MPATVTTLDREIAREERCAGLPAGQPPTDGAIAHRRLQIAALMVACGLVAIYAAYAAAGTVQTCAIALAVAFGVYAIGQDRHLRRLAALCDDSRRITLVVAGELIHSGALADRELLDLRDAVGRCAGALCAALADTMGADCVRVRLVGPSGEVPVAAERDLAPRRPLLDDPATAARAARMRAPVRAQVGNRSVMAVPVWRGDDEIALLELVGPPGARYGPSDAALVDAFATGAVAALRVPR
jgi:hypothetical protein